jgi:hypothetical protein
MAIRAYASLPSLQTTSAGGATGEIMHVTYQPNLPSWRGGIMDMGAGGSDGVGGSAGAGAGGRSAGADDGQAVNGGGGGSSNGNGAISLDDDFQLSATQPISGGGVGGGRGVIPTVEPKASSETDDTVTDSQTVVKLG